METTKQLLKDIEAQTAEYRNGHPVVTCPVCKGKFTRSDARLHVAAAH